MAVPPSCNHAKATGFTLLEMLVTLVILSGGLLSLTAFYYNLMSGLAQSKQRTEAVFLAEKKLEEMRGSNFASLTSAADTVTASATSGSSANYQRSWIVTPNTSPVYDDVSISVSWTDSQGHSQSATLVDRISSVSTSPQTIQ